MRYVSMMVVMVVMAGFLTGCCCKSKCAMKEKKPCAMGEKKPCEAGCTKPCCAKM